MDDQTATYPASIEVRTPERLANWRPLVQWLLAVPHLLIASVLQWVAGVVVIISWFAIVFTGRLPQGLSTFPLMALRYSLRAQAYAGFLHDQYPAFEFPATPAEPSTGPVTVHVSPELEGRNRLTVGLRFLWVIPAALFAVVVGIVGAVCWFLAFFAVLFTGRWPEGLRRWVMASLRVNLRLNAYAWLLTDEYPPFTAD